MKKLYAILLTAVLVITMAVPIFAAESPSAKTAALEKAAPATAVTTSVQGGVVKTLPGDVKEAIAIATSNAQHLANLGVSADAKLVSSFDFSYPADKIPEGGIVVPFKVSNAKAGDLAIVLHRCANSSWEKVGEAILGADLTVNGTFTSTSPVAIMIVDASKAAAAGVKAPKTGEF